MTQVIVRDGSIEDAAYHESQAHEPDRVRGVAFLHLCQRVLDRLDLIGCEEIDCPMGRTEAPTAAEIAAASSDLLQGVYWCQPDWRRPFEWGLGALIEETWRRRAELPYGIEGFGGGWLEYLDRPIGDGRSA